MEAGDPRASPPGGLPQDDCGLWMKLDSSPVTAHTHVPSVASGEKPQASPAAITRYCTVMDDEGADDVFIPLPPCPLLPKEGSTEATANNSSVTLSNKAADATEAEANPSGLDRHHGEKQLMAAQVDEVTTNTEHSYVNEGSLSNNNNSNPAKDQDPAFVEDLGRRMEKCNNPCGAHHQDRRDGDSSEQTEDTTRQEHYSKVERNEYLNQTPSNTEDNSENETHSAKISGSTDKDTNVMAGNPDRDGVGTYTVTLCALSAADDEDSSESPEPDTCNRNETNAATNQPLVPQTPADVTDDDQELVNTRPLNYNLAKNDWVRRESGTSEKLPMADSLEYTKANQGEGIGKLVTDIQQGEQLLQRLQLVQQRQDVYMSESRLNSQQAVQETQHQDKVVPGAEVDNLIAGKDDQNVGKETTPLMSEHCLMAAGTETNSLDHGDSWVPHEESTTKVCVLPAQHRFSVAETSMEIQEVAHENQSLQRAGGVFNLADNPDVLEIPFETNILLEPFPPNVSQSKHSNWPFSEQKTQKEISHETQRELILLDQGKIPAGYGKGEVRQLKETKLLFDAFQQVNAEGPTRHRKSPTLMKKANVYPSVLERTCSLEMFFLKSYPITRAHSLRLYKSVPSEREKSPENIRSKSPTGVSQDKTRLSPYPVKDKHLKTYRGTVCLSPSVSTSAVEMRGNAWDSKAKQESPILKQNPFVKLRPALALQPELEKDIREAREREEELRRQRCTLYGENRQKSQEEKSGFRKTPEPGVTQQTTGRLDRVWPPPSKKDLKKSEQTQEARAQRAGGQKAPLWQRWESGLINGQQPQEND